jgi:hypothetical protein
MHKNLVYIGLVSGGILTGILLACFLLLPHYTTPVSGDAEKDSQTRLKTFQRELTDAADAATSEGTERVSKKIEAQLRLEDLTIKTRESRYSKLTLLGPTLTPLITFFFGALLHSCLASKKKDGTA